MSEATKTCIMCGDETMGSMDGPYVCGRCDCGIRPDGEKFTLDDATDYCRRVGEWRTVARQGNPDHFFTPIFGPDRKEAS